EYSSGSISTTSSCLSSNSTVNRLHSKRIISSTYNADSIILLILHSTTSDPCILFTNASHYIFATLIFRRFSPTDHYSIMLSLHTQFTHYYNGYQPLHIRLILFFYTSTSVSLLLGKASSDTSIGSPSVLNGSFEV